MINYLGFWMNDNVKEYYKKMRMEKDKMKKNDLPSATYFMDFILEQISDLIKKEKIYRIIDIGGNDGGNLKILIDQESDNKIAATCFDIYCDKKYPNITYINGDAVDLPSYFIKESFDMAFLFDVIEHIPETDKVIRNVSHILKTSGLLILTTPNLSSLVSRLSLLFGFLPPSMEVSYEKSNFGRPNLGGYPVGHLRVFTFKAITEFIKFYGYQIIKSFTLPRLYSLPPSFNGAKIRLRTLVKLYNVIEGIGYGFNDNLASNTIIICRKM